MPTLIDVGLIAPINETWVVALSIHILNSDIWGTTIIGGEDHQGILSESVSVQCIQHLTYRIINFDTEIAVGTQITYSLVGA